jgi:hypothetical protein
MNKIHPEKAKTLHEKDLKGGFEEVYLPYTLVRRYPNTGRAWMWQYIFPPSKRSINPRSGVTRQHPIDE